MQARAEADAQWIIKHPNRVAHIRPATQAELTVFGEPLYKNGQRARILLTVESAHLVKRRLVYEKARDFDRALIRAARKFDAQCVDETSQTPKSPERCSPNLSTPARKIPPQSLGTPSPRPS